MLSLYERSWASAGWLLRRPDAQAAHDRTQALLRRADASATAAALARVVGRATLPRRPTRVGGVTLPTPIVLAAGFVKCQGFVDEATAQAAVARGESVIPGWRIMPGLVGAVELGSFTREARPGNAGRVIWRDDATRSTQNRVGLRNPGAAAAAAFLRAQGTRLPRTFGVSLAVSPGVDDMEESTQQVREAAACFVSAFAGSPRGPTWYTLNLSCPNTNDDPAGYQTDALARRLCGALVESVDVPAWVKVGPGLPGDRYALLVDAFADSGISAVVATNTLARPVPDGSTTAGLGGAALRPMALDAVAHLGAAIRRRGASLDVIASGGILSGADLVTFRSAGASAAMIYSALIFRGPLAAALILREAATASDA
ncbi:quinone-dependent dihydroorotate dehydrogenase [soil metagenome]